MMCIYNTGRASSTVMPMDCPEDHALIADMVSDERKRMEDMLSQLSMDLRMVLVFFVRTLTV